LIPVILAILAIAVLTLVAILSIKGWSFDRRVGRRVDEMLNRAGAPEMVDVDTLPTPVARFIRSTGILEEGPIHSVRLRQRGVIRQDEESKWMPFTAEQYYTTSPRAFIWSARAKLAPLVTARILDSYRDGRGRLEVFLGPLSHISDASGPEMDQGSMTRFFNETMWFPSALLDPGVTWEAIDDHNARATMVDEGQQATAEFRFDDRGNLVDFETERHRMVGDDATLLRWSTPIEKTGKVGGKWLPRKGRALWHMESRDLCYIELEITDIEFNVTGTS
jgi:hypothetical protein